MLHRMVWPMILVALLVGLSPTPASPEDRPGPSIRAFEMAAVVMDRQGIRTELSSFGRLFGSGALAAHHGDADIQIPFERMRSFRVGMMKDSRAPVTVQLIDGAIMEIEIDTQEYTTAFSGKTSYGIFRILLGKIASCTFRSTAAEKVVERVCSSGHLWRQADYRFCPYDGKPLQIRPRRPAEDSKEDK